MCLEFGHVSAHFEPFGKLLLVVSVSDRTYKLHFECMHAFLCCVIVLKFGKVSAHCERF